MRSTLALIGSILSVVAVAACSRDSGKEVEFNLALQTAPDTIVMDVRCPDRAVTGGIATSVVPWVANADSIQPIVWTIASSAQVQQLTIDRSGSGAWPFKARPPYRVTPQQPVSQLERDSSWTKGKTAHYMISGTCNGHAFTLDPDMIVY